MNETWRPFEPCLDNYPSTPVDDPIAEARRRAREELKAMRDVPGPSFYERKRLESTQKKTCKLHRDCREADEMVRAAGGRLFKINDGLEVVVMTAKHE
jgi:hypothetical protein